MLSICSLLLLPGIIAAQRRDTLTAEQIVRQAIERRIETRRATEPFAAALHTRSTIEGRTDGARIASRMLPVQRYEGEMVGTYYHDDRPGTRLHVTAERGIVLKPGLMRTVIENFRWIGETFSVDDERIVILNTALTSPLAADAMDHYSYRMEGETSYRGEPAYDIHFSPATSLRPAFTGTMLITKESFDLGMITLRVMSPEQAAIPFVEYLNLTERFAPVAGGFYQPDSLLVGIEGKATMLAFGAAEFHISLATVGIFSDRRINVSLPDSLRTAPDNVVISSKAVTTPQTFWREGTMLKEYEIARIEESRRMPPPSPFRFSALPYIDYNRAGGASLGGSATVGYGPATVGAMGGYSFGLERPIGTASLTFGIGNEESLHGTLHGGAFSEITTVSVGDKSYPRIMNTLVAASLHQDYYNFFRKDGWSIGGELDYAPLRLSAAFEQSRHFSIGNNARWSLLTWNGKEFQQNPSITDGSYQTMQVELAQNRVVPFLKITPVADLDIRWSLLGLLGERTDSSSDFRLAEALLSLSFPIVETGYNPMTLTLLGAAGIGTPSLPPQYQFRLRTSAASFGKPGGFVSPPKGLYGGTEYLAFGAEINTTDLWWRAIGLPTWNGRGIELIVAGGSARYRQQHPSGFTGTGDLWYSEAGIALSRIPLFLTDLVYGRVDLRQGLGPLGVFGGNFTFVLPL